MLEVMCLMLEASRVLDHENSAERGPGLEQSLEIEKGGVVGLWGYQAVHRNAWSASRTPLS